MNQYQELIKDLKRQAILVQIVGDPEGSDGLFAEAHNALIDMQSRLESLEKDAAILREAVEDYLTAQDDLDNREYHGINAEPYEKLIRHRNYARDALDTAMKG